MRLREIQNQALQLPLGERWHLVESLLRSIQQETISSPQPIHANSFTDLDPWTQQLVGVLHLETEDSRKPYVDYLEEKYS
jgi:hypothetical protein